MCEIADRWRRLAEACLSKGASEEIVIEPGTAADAAGLLAMHYNAAKPATVVRVLRARDQRDDSLAGVLLVSMPTLRGSWRAAAWPEEREILSVRRHAAAWLNRRVRTISRVVVAPEWRGLGIARRLVRAYLDDPVTERTEAVAGMGAICPFFEQAGMRPVAVARGRRDARLSRVMRAAKVEPWMLLEERRARAILEREPALSTALRAWANDSAATRKLVDATPESLAFQGACRVLARPVAFVTP